MLLTGEPLGASGMAAAVISLDDHRIKFSRKRATDEQKAAMVALRTAGMTCKDIGIRLNLADSTVNYHVGYIYRSKAKRRPTPVLTPEFLAAIVAERSTLMAVAVKRTSNVPLAEDCVQETLLRAMERAAQFIPGTNLGAWLVTILRNEINDTARSRRREVEDVDGGYAARQPTPPQQGVGLEMERLQEALTRINPHYREALMVTAVEGLTNEEAAARLGVPIGTIKSRVSRGREALAKILHYDADEIATDGLMAAAQQITSVRHD